MKFISTTAFIGILISLPVIYWLEPPNNGAIGAIVFLCVGLTTLAKNIFVNLVKEREADTD